MAKYQIKSKTYQNETKCGVHKTLGWSRKMLWNRSMALGDSESYIVGNHNNQFLIIKTWHLISASIHNGIK